jgi:hypothetical protein
LVGRHGGPGGSTSTLYRQAGLNLCVPFMASKAIYRRCFSQPWSKKYTWDRTLDGNHD